MTSEVKMPVVAWRSRWYSDTGMIGHYPWSYRDGDRVVERATFDTERLVLQSDALAAIEAARVEAEKLREKLAEARALADSEGTRAVEYLRRARKAEAALAEALAPTISAFGCGNESRGLGACHRWCGSDRCVYSVARDLEAPPMGREGR